MFWECFKNLELKENKIFYFLIRRWRSQVNSHSCWGSLQQNPNKIPILRDWELEIAILHKRRQSKDKVSTRNGKR